MVDGGRRPAVTGDRPLIAAVIYNRLKQGIPLGIDATIRFATGNWSRPLRVSELQINSGYNTRTHQGLPPGPIGNPGLASLKAAAHPARVKYLFYVVKPCGNGAHAFSSTDAQFQRDVAKYNTARAKKAFAEFEVAGEGVFLGHEQHAVLADSFAERVDALERKIDRGCVAGELMQDSTEVVVDGAGYFIEGAAELVEARFENVVHDFVAFSCFSNETLLFHTSAAAQREERAARETGLTALSS